MKIQKLTPVLTVIIILIATVNVNGHFTCCTTIPGADIGLCEPKDDSAHGFECEIGGNCLTSPAWYQLVKKCNCRGETSSGCGPIE